MKIDFQLLKKICKFHSGLFCDFVKDRYGISEIEYCKKENCHVIEKWIKGGRR